MADAQAAARTLGLEIVASEIRRAEDIAPKAMAQLLQDLANELAYLAQRMIRRNPLLRPNVREKAALILEPSAHLTLPQNHCGKSESPPLRSGELFQQTARAFSACPRPYRGSATPR